MILSTTKMVSTTTNFTTTTIATTAIVIQSITNWLIVTLNLMNVKATDKIVVSFMKYHNFDSASANDATGLGEVRGRQWGYHSERSNYYHQPHWRMD
jgi:hypothetical protein